ncbi:DUF397 domain-containing protein [Actinacidiphila epipremni]|uniref:DUF397 domain-containing protein n=1 Tax=Actinacidiphila epipremni TaxID=2053013 RepID=A0ABX0ZTW3_9ACTN|nr:DUF397 domain-containing protein [Actinacidiphila epipremni]NJP45058.1 DUF397 domain-containing protein [Actinacidiphila epipremni]
MRGGPASVQWRTSSYSGGNGQCVEVGAATASVAVRDSKDREGPALVFTAEAWGAFVLGVRAGELAEA